MKRSIIIFLCCIGSIYAQQTQFFRTYSMGVFDVGETVIPINDTNYVVAGTTNITGMNGTDMLLFKTNSNGDVTWWKNIGGTGIQSGKGAVMAADSTGYFITGYKNNFDSTGYDVWLVKANLSGDTVWSRSYGGDDWEIAHAINKLPDSTYIIAGETYSFGNGQRDMYILRVDGSGDTLWTRTLGGTADDVAKYIHIDRHDNILIVGNTESFGAGNSDVYLIYMDLNGDTIWTKTIGTADDDFGYSADMYIDGSNQMSFGIGYTSYYAPDQAQNSYILIIDSVSGADIALKPQLEADPGILDHIMVKYEKPGIFGYSAELKDQFDHISIVFANKTNYGLDFNTSYMFYASGGNESTKPLWLNKALDKGYIITGFSENWGPGPTACFLLKTDTLLNAPNTPTVSIEDLQETLVELFPNPVIDQHFYLNSSEPIQSVRILGINGQLIYSYSILQFAKTLTLERPMVAEGIYMVEITTTEGTIYKKIVF